MRKPEQRLWDSMRRNNKKQLHTINLERVENVVTVGMPDIYVKYYSSECWVELKTCKLPKRETTRVLGDKGLSQDQINWHQKHNVYGLRSYILIKADKKLFLLPNKYAERINDMTQIQLFLASQAMSWEQIFEVLRKSH